MDLREKLENRKSGITLNDQQQNHTNKIRFEYEDDDDHDEIIEEGSTAAAAAATGSSNLEWDSAMCEPEDSTVDGDKTSADYYFDSYSHFGIHEVSVPHLSVKK